MWIGSAESASEHPLGKALANWAVLTLNDNDDEREEPEFESVAEFEAVGGKGIKCKVDGNGLLLIGNRSWLRDHDFKIGQIAEEFASHAEEKGQTVVLVAREGFTSAVAVLSIADTIKDEARNVVSALQNRGVEVWMVTGDNAVTARAIADQVGIENVFAEVLPANKAEKVEELQANNHVVAMVGDGINDSPALAQADVGIAIGCGTDVAIQTADVVLMRSDLRDVAVAIDISSKTYRRIKINLFWAFIYNVAAIPIAAGVLYPAIKMALPPMVAGLAMALSSVSVTVSSLLLKLYRKPKELFYQAVTFDGI
eukprot:TRINITY_DN2339_c0_g1_i1.p1 TRINITY_DN2339_c0_g1~~TRINITY_DN2339_c0_g1_i1.p1  ORF type:complete len:312 (-),score=53.88 TRINITY_DN2339_c0_g1_i1:59-994(-)